MKLISCLFTRRKYDFIIMSRRPSPLDTENCRNCSSFADYVKVAKRKAYEEGDGKVSENGDNGVSAPSRSDCPLDKDELGRGTWGLLHTIAAKYPESPSKTEQNNMNEFLHILSDIYPCDHCAEDFRKELKVDPPKTSSQEVFSQWLCRLHNRVNKKVGKDEFDCSKVNERWRDGWIDGSCDY